MFAVDRATLEELARHSNFSIDWALCFDNPEKAATTLTETLDRIAAVKYYRPKTLGLSQPKVFKRSEKLANPEGNSIAIGENLINDWPKGGLLSYRRRCRFICPLLIKGFLSYGE